MQEGILLIFLKKKFFHLKPMYLKQKKKILQKEQNQEDKNWMKLKEKNKT